MAEAQRTYDTQIDIELTLSGSQVFLYQCSFLQEFASVIFQYQLINLLAIFL